MALMIYRARGDLTPELVEAFADGPLVAWDTETSGLDWAEDRLELCQLSAPSVGTVVVQLVASRPVNLMRLLGDDRVTKVFHHAPFDLAFMRSAWRVRARNVRCTKIASKLLHPDAPRSAHSLRELASRYLGVTLEKGAVRTSNWGSELLTEEQLAYARGDVEHLVELYSRLLHEIDRAGLGELYAATCGFLPHATELEVRGIPDPFRY